MSSRVASTTGAVIYLLCAGSALASPCMDRIAALQTRLDEASEAAASASSGGQGVAAARESQAMQSRNRNAPIEPQTVPPFQSGAKEAEATRDAAKAGGGGDRVMQARAQLNEARSLDERGDGAGCLALVERAERQLAPQ